MPDFKYEAPVVEELGSVSELTANHDFDKIGSAIDQFTGQSNLNGDVIPDPHP